MHLRARICVSQELNDAQAILVDESGLGITPENLGIITAYHHISFKTAHTCFEHLNGKSKMKSLLQVLSHATEFDSLPLRPGDDLAITRILKHAKFAVQSLFADARSKANALLQAHFGRTALRGDLVADQSRVRTSSHQGDVLGRDPLQRIGKPRFALIVSALRCARGRIVG